VGFGPQRKVIYEEAAWKERPGSLFDSIKEILAKLRPELIPVNQHTAVIAVRADFARDHLDWHTDLRGLIAQVGQLSRDHGAFFQFDQSDSVRRVGLIPGGGIVHDRKRVDFSATAKRILLFGFTAAVRAYISRRKYLSLAVRANLSDQSITLLF
jgi:hypothetical protein